MFLNSPPDGRTSILVVDDEQQICSFLCDLLSMDFDVEAVHCARDALDRVAANGTKYDLMISDIRMPGMSGLELLGEIKATGLDVIMMTGNADLESAITALKMGAYDYIRKPFNIDEILLAIQRVVDRQQLQREADRYRNHLEELVAERTQQYKTLVINTMKALVRSLEFKDRYTRHHSENVARYAAALARELGHDDAKVSLIVTSGLLHDLGKIGVRDDVLNKPGRLTDEEFEHVKKHPEIGAAILGPIIEEADILAAVRHHHEAFDGCGYPDGLAGESIPWIARLLCVADSYDAMRSDRSYREGMSHTEALRRIDEAAGRQFDPDMADAFTRLDFDELRARILAREPFSLPLGLWSG